MKELPRFIDSGCWNTGHCQGIAVDLEKGFVYYSFTTTLVKTDLQGRLVGTVSGLLGHLGCIDFCEGDGRVYGSLEYKSDAIGRGILAHLGREDQLRDAFYAAIFDVDRIDRPGMDATADGVMTTVYLREVVEDYHAQVVCGGRTVDHRHGCRQPFAVPRASGAGLSGPARRQPRDADGSEERREPGALRRTHAPAQRGNDGPEELRSFPKNKGRP